MRFLKPFSIVVASLIAAWPGVASAVSYTGSWPVTISHSQHSNGTACLTLDDGGSYGFKHSGLASLVTAGGSKLPYGTFQVIDRILVATIEAEGYGQNAGLVFIAPVDHFNLKNGTYDEVYGGGEFDSGALTFGAKGGCSNRR